MSVSNSWYAMGVAHMLWVYIVCDKCPLQWVYIVWPFKATTRGDATQHPLPLHTTATDDRTYFTTRGAGGGGAAPPPPHFIRLPQMTVPISLQGGGGALPLPSTFHFLPPPQMTVPISLQGRWRCPAPTPLHTTTLDDRTYFPYAFIDSQPERREHEIHTAWQRSQGGKPTESKF